MVDGISEKEKLAQKFAKLEMKEKLIKEKERKLRTKRLIELGSIITSAGLDDLEKEILLGAFLEIKNLSGKDGKINDWREKGKGFLKTDEELNPQPLIISFASELPGEIKTALKKKKFKWNQFRREWYGYGKKEELEKSLSGLNANVEVASAEE